MKDNIAIGIMTSINLKQRFMACKNTWTKDFDNVFFFGGDKQDENLIRLEGIGEDYSSAFMKQQLGMKRMFEASPEFDWYCMIGCDHIIFKDSLLDALKNFDRNEDVIISQVRDKIIIDKIETVIFSGGASFFMSNSLMKKIYPKIDEFNAHWRNITNPTTYFSNVSYDWADIAIAYIVKKYTNVDATNVLGMYSQNPSFYDEYNIQEGIKYGGLEIDNVGHLKNPISFHYIKPDEMKSVYEKFRKKKYIFYHIYLYDKINDIVSDQLKKLKNSGLLDISELYVTIMDNYNGTYKIDNDNMEIISKYATEIYYDNSNTFELFTLQKLHQHALNHDGNYLYFHTKGCTRVNDADVENFAFGLYVGNYSYKNVENWRNIMEHFTIEHWLKCVEHLNNGSDLAGCNYNNKWSPQHYSGNFWWASSDFLKKLPDPFSFGVDRMNAEMWIGRIKHKAVCLYPLPIKEEEHNRFVVYTEPENYLNNITINEYYNYDK